VPMSLASVGDRRVENMCDHDPHHPNERMTEPTKSRKTKARLPCQWVDEAGFEVTPSPGPANDPQTLPDTAFLLKPTPLPRPPQFPNS
jgi:hypothetical protein